MDLQLILDHYQNIGNPVIGHKAVYMDTTALISYIHGQGHHGGHQTNGNSFYVFFGKLKYNIVQLENLRYKIDVLGPPVPVVGFNATIDKKFSHQIFENYSSKLGSNILELNFYQEQTLLFDDIVITNTDQSDFSFGTVWLESIFDTSSPWYIHTIETAQPFTFEGYLLTLTS